MKLDALPIETSLQYAVVSCVGSLYDSTAEMQLAIHGRDPGVHDEYTRALVEVTGRLLGIDTDAARELLLSL